MQVIWTQVLNAVTMLSPLVALIVNCKKKRIYKRTPGKTLIVHIPISIAYHLSSALNVPMPITNKFKKADLALIHIYTVTVHETWSDSMTRMCWGFGKLSCVMNTMCVFRVVQGHSDTIFRLASLYASSFNLLNRIRRKTTVVLLGIASSVLFYFDDQFLYLGHPAFHVLLGFIHNHVFQLED